MRRLWRSSKQGSDTNATLAERGKRVGHKSDLWAQAYQELIKDNPKLLLALEDILNSHSQEIKDERVPSTGLRPTPPFNDVISTPYPLPTREEDMSRVIESRLAIMEDNKWRLRMGEHSIEVRQQIERIIKIVTVAKDFVSSAASMDPIHAGLPWAGICVLLPLIANDSKQRSSAMDGLEYITKLVRRYTEIERLYLRQQAFRLADDLRIAVCKIYRLILEFQARAACQFSRNTAHQAIRNIVTADGWDGILTSIKDHDTTCEILLRLIDVEDSRLRTEELEELMKKQNQRVLELMEVSRKHDEASHHSLLGELQRGTDFHLDGEASRCHECLRTSDYELGKEKNPDRIPGTCEWFLQHQRYRTWLEATGSAWLWVTADPGCGKSVLSRFLVDSFKDSEDTPAMLRESGIVCYFFFKDDADSNRSATNGLASVLHQLFSQDHELIQYALPAYKENGRRLAQLFESLWDIFRRIVTDSPRRKITVIFDALDECEEVTRTLLVRKLAQMFSVTEQKGFLKLLITSRPSTPIGDQLWRGKIDPASIRLTGENEDEMEAISVEIDLVIREKIKHFNELRRYRSINDSAHEALSDRLRQVENRTYLWVALIFPELERCAGRSKKMLLDIIKSVPTTVNEAYEKILSRSSDMRAARKLLRIVLGAPRPLTLDEMNIALSIEDRVVPGPLPRLNLDELIIPFSTHDESRSIDQLDLDSVASFRTTVRDLCGLFGFNEFTMAVYLQFTYFAGLVRQFVDVDAKDSHSRSALWWALEKGISEERICAMMNYMEFDSLAVLQMAAILGRATVVEYILSKSNICARTKASDGWEASQRAAVHGHVEVLERLKRFEILNTEFELDETALYEAAADASEDMTSHPILEHVKPEARTSDGETLLYRCIANQKTAVAKILLRRCADVDGLIYNPWNADGFKYGETLLYRAASELDKTMVFMLLEHGAKVEAKSRLAETALYRVACRIQGDATDQADIAKVLIERGADITFKTGTGDTPLRRAIDIGREPLKSLMMGYARTMGFDGETEPLIIEASQDVAQNDEYLSIIRDSGLIDMDDFKDLLEFESECARPDRDLSRMVYERSFWNIGTMINRVRDDIIRKQVLDMVIHASKASKSYGAIGYPKVCESFGRLMALRSDFEDDDSCVTEDQWAEMTQELVTLERSLAETKTVLQRYYRAISARRTPGSKRSN
ncbi:MAG: hypothetical protein Q9182_006912 [Xanthomendoza sp. 2 TL-2023]